MLVKDAALAAAESALSNYWNGSFPVDPTLIARRIGIAVKSATFQDADTSGAIIAKEGAPTVIYLADSDPLQRKTFTCAHELGHYFDRVTADDSEYSFVEKRHPSNYDLHEFYADEFAGNLLMPQDQFCKLFAAGEPLSTIASYFAVSLPAAEKRLDRLRKYGHIS